MADSRFPIHVDFSAHLAAEGVTIAAVSLTIHSTEWAYVGDPDGKPEYEIADEVTFKLGENETNRQSIFAQMLANAEGHSHSQLWFYNQLSFAIQRRMSPHVHPFGRIASRIRKQREAQNNAG